MRLSPYVSCFVLGAFVILLLGCGGGEDGFAGTSATLSWDPVAYAGQVSYSVHYGKNSSGGSGSCSYEHTVDVAEPYAFIAGLEPNTQYYFAVTVVVDGQRSLCSDEVSKMTSETELRIGDPPVDVHSPSPPCDDISCAALRGLDCRDQREACGGGRQGSL